MKIWMMTFFCRVWKDQMIGFKNIDRRRMIHCIKVGLALVLVSLLYLLNPVFKHVGENAIWAIMTVVLILDFYAGATIGKGINRGLGTIMGGAMGFLASSLAHKLGGNIGKPLIIALSIFFFGCGATYCRMMVPRLKKRYDYSFMVSILTFNLVAVSGVHDAHNVLELALDRLSTIAMGVGICMFISLFVFPVWASNELHYSTAAKFHKMADCIQGCLDAFLKVGEEKDSQGKDGNGYMQHCKSILNSKSSDETLANFAKWEPWHGKFGLHNPWDKYLEVGEQLRQLAPIILSLNSCLQSPKQPLPMHRQKLKNFCEDFSVFVGCVLRELGEEIKNLELCQTKVKLQLSPPLCSCEMEGEEADENLAIATLSFLVLEAADMIEKLVVKVEELGEAAGFRARTVDV